MHETYKTYKTYKMMMGAPVFALAGYAAASLVIPRGFACRCLFWLGAKSYRRVLPLFVLARAKTYRRAMPRAELPPG